MDEAAEEPGRRLAGRPWRWSRGRPKGMRRPSTCERLCHLGGFLLVALAQARAEDTSITTAWLRSHIEGASG